MRVKVLRELFRNLQVFKTAYENYGLDTITGPDGVVYCLWDVEYLYSQIYRLSPRQRQAIELCLVANITEKDVAVMMGLSPTNPVAMYATLGLEKLVQMIEQGELPGYRESELAIA